MEQNYLTNPFESTGTKGNFLFTEDIETLALAIPSNWGFKDFNGPEVTRTRHNTAGTPTFRTRFRTLAEQWERETKFTSSLRDIVSNKSYREIIALGPPAIPLILANLRARPQGWFWALTAITGENPVRPEHRGNLVAMAGDWLVWGAGKGYGNEGKF